MVTHLVNTLISSSEISKKFGAFLSLVSSKSVEKIAILKNNHIEAVLISKYEYEKMREIVELI